MAAVSCLLAFAACQKDPTPSVSVEDKTIEASADGGSERVSISSNVNLTATSDANWIEASIGNGEAIINVKENYGPSREGSVLIRYNDQIEATIAVKQQAGNTDDIKEVEAFYYGSVEGYGAGTQDWVLTFYSRGYMDMIEGVSQNTYTFDLMATDEFTFTSGKFPVGEFTLNPMPEVGAIYGVNSNVMDGYTYESEVFTEASLIIEKTDVEEEYAFYVKCKKEGSDLMRFCFKAVCGTNGNFMLRKYDTRVSSTITSDYDITFNENYAELYPVSDEEGNANYLYLDLRKGTPAMGVVTGENCSTEALFTICTPKSEDISGEYDFDNNWTCAPYTIFYSFRNWNFFGAYPDPSDPDWMRPLENGTLTPSDGRITLKKQADGSYEFDGHFTDDYTEDYPCGKHTVKIHGRFTVTVAEE